MEERKLNDTVCALATPFGTSALALIRVSGVHAFEKCRRLSRSMDKKVQAGIFPCVWVEDLRGLDGNTIDQVVWTLFSETRSYTGENTVEISCHGNPSIIETILKELALAGCRPALPGEFTYRAFMNDKLDLVQAEAVLSLIESENLMAQRIALQNVHGKLSLRFLEVEQTLIRWLAQVEVSLDFVEEDVPLFSTPKLAAEIRILIAQLRDWVSSYQQGQFLKSGVQVTLVGRPNVGKSSLLNLLLGEEKAIVSEIAGTTRDVVEGHVRFEGSSFHLHDTAGIRATQDSLEKMGVERGRKAQSRADQLVFVYEANEGWREEDQRIFEGLTSAGVLFVGTKRDLKSRETPPPPGPFVEVNSREDVFRAEVLAFIQERVGLKKFDPGAGTVLLQARQADLCEKVSAALVEASKVGDQGLAPEFVAVFLRQALAGVQEILGKRYDDEILDRVFRDFCIGK